MEYDTADDAFLIRACRKGDELAWRTLVERYAQLIYRIPLRCGLSFEQADDVVQNVFVLLIEKLDQLEQPDRVRAWLVTAARWESLRAIRARSHTSEVALLDNEAEQSLDPDLLVITTEQRRLVRQALAMLDPRCSDLLRMLFCHLPTPTYGEIARALSISEGSIGPTRARCLRKLRQILDELGL
ncbi:MAG: sigma-70 family RNA polymerase sigma factor [Chloroflexaceae bacterium]|nr:sigma-70 family RNA polymerase sigma factor [Chloroflexaceae bacterium]